VKESLDGDDNRKVMIYCLQQTRAEHTLVRTVENVLQSLEMDPYAVESFTGLRAKRMKQYLIAMLKDPDSTLRVLTSTSAGDAGINSRYIGDVIFDGPPSNKYDDNQKRGRTDRRGTALFNNGPPRCTYIISFLHIEKILKQNFRKDPSSQKRAKRELFEVMKMLVFPNRCIHRWSIEQFSPSDNKSPAVRSTTEGNNSSCNGSTDAAEKCGNCFYCDPSLAEKELIFDKSALMMALTMAMSGKKASYADLASALKESSSDIWPRESNDRKATAIDVERVQTCVPYCSTSLTLHSIRCSQQL